MHIGRRGRALLPEGRQYALTWSIPDDFGGMTSALLHRSRAFTRIGASPVTVLTFDGRPDYPSVEAELRSDGRLAPGMAVVNLWDWLRDHPLPGGTLRLDRDVFTPLAPGGAPTGKPTGQPTGRIVETARDGQVLSRSRLSSSGRVLQVDHYRLDGSLLASDRRDARVAGEPGGRSIVLCGPDGAPVRSWRRVRHLYVAWLDAVTARRPSVLVIDSKTVADLLVGYRRRHVVTAHVVHASHLVGSRRPLGTLRESRRRVFENLDGFDLVAVLTERQRDDVTALLGEHRHVRVIPNAHPVGPRGARGRDATAGVVLASLTPRKRVDHALGAVAALHDRSTEEGVGLQIFGDGEERETLGELIRARRLEGAVSLRGFDPGAAAHLRDASFLLSTSTSEGFPLVLLESMAAGCLPIAYDVPYGPADIVRDHRNGFLVPPGDVEALAGAISELERMPAGRRERMRRRARRSVRRFSDEAVTRRWAEELAAAWERKSPTAPVLRRLRRRLTAGALRRVPALQRVRRLARSRPRPVSRRPGPADATASRSTGRTPRRRSG